MATKPTIWVNTAPRKNNRRDGSVFYTVLCGVSDAVLRANNITTKVDTITMEVFANELDRFNEDFQLAKKHNLKLVVRGDEVIVTEPKVNSYEKDGKIITGLQASCWATNPERDVVTRETRTGSALAELRATTTTDDDAGVSPFGD